MTVKRAPGNQSEAVQDFTDLLQESKCMRLLFSSMGSCCPIGATVATVEAWPLASHKLEKTCQRRLNLTSRRAAETKEKFRQLTEGAVMH